MQEGLHGEQGEHDEASGPSQGARNSKYKLGRGLRRGNAAIVGAPKTLDCRLRGNDTVSSV
jgi:hypothetical protein